MNDFEKANSVVHKVETQWHYPILTKYGYVPITKEATGFVRCYVYQHPETKHEIKAHTGANCDYWTDSKYPTKGTNYWADLDPHLEAIWGLTF